MNNEFTLIGIEANNAPLASEIKLELDYLQNRRSDFVVLSKREDFIQATNSPKRKGFFNVEISIEEANGGGLMTLDKAIPKAEVLRLFTEFYNTSSLVIDNNWEEVNNRKLRKESKGFLIVLIIISIVILMASSIGAISSQRPIIEGIVAGLLVVGFVMGIQLFIAPFYHEAERKVIKKSVQLEMPCEIIVRRIKVIDRKKRDIRKLRKLEKMLLRYIVLGVFLTLLLLGAFVGIAYLLQEYTTIWGF